MAKELVMTFLNEQGKKVSLSVEDPKEDIKEEDIKKVMDSVVAKNIFGSKGGNLVKVDGAKIVTTTAKEFEFNK